MLAQIIDPPFTKFDIDWRLTKPKMHTEGELDPPPDAEQFLGDVVCEHGKLATNVTTRRRISAEVSHVSSLREA